ncbi:hypothetical protein [Citricoccus sp. K5]|uniref:hypothetical protein n=1 Tax=Citricoccus sp. K5 TaxID=2653135 RepID=UPI0012F29720|nr:hypothetical protein [Citricoccus sp. K5]VXB22109.1 hypothetical protein CITRIK5_20639 [Citricoccus sp. K5]
MNQTLLITLIGGALAIAGSAGLWQYLSSRRDRPLKAKEVDNASFTALTAGYAGFVERMDGELDRLSTELASQGTQIKELREEVRGLRAINGQLRLALQSAVAFIDDLHHRWEYHRMQKNAPPKPHLDYDYE